MMRSLIRSMSLCGVGALLLSQSTLLAQAPTENPEATQFRPTASVHWRELERNRSRPVHPQHYQDSSPAAGTNPSPFGPRSAEPCGKVMGWLPPWIDPQHIQWDTLTHLAMYTIIPTTDGEIQNAYGWPWTATIERARSRNVKVLLSITFGFLDEPNRLLLSNPQARARLIENLRPLAHPHADGISVDLEGNYSDRWAHMMPGFLAQLKSELGAGHPNFEVYAATPWTDWGGGWDFIACALAGDGLFIMGYDFYGPWSGQSGPCSPFTGGIWNITETMDGPYRAVRSLYPERVMLGLPYYANHWRTETDQPYSTAQYASDLHYQDASRFAQLYGRRWHTLTQTPYVAWQESGSWNQVWYDDAESLGLKIDAALARGLGGIGMWALGYDGQHPELWNLLRDRMVDDCASCPADFDDGSASGTPDGAVTIDDLIYYAQLFATGAAAADIDDGSGTGTRDGGVSIDDFLYFVARFQQGC
jgi:spore germination protein YaaH